MLPLVLVVDAAFPFASYSRLGSQLTLKMLLILPPAIPVPLARAGTVIMNMC